MGGYRGLRRPKAIKLACGRRRRAIGELVFLTLASRHIGCGVREAARSRAVLTTKGGLGGVSGDVEVKREVVQVPWWS